MHRIGFRIVYFSALLAAALLPGSLCAQPSRAAAPQSQQQQQPSKQKSKQEQQAKPQTHPSYSSSSTSQAEASSPSDNPNVAPDPHKFDRYHAEQDIEVATFYLHKGDPDAAIPRLQEAARLRPHYGKPRLLLAECYEKKHDPDNTIKYLKEYLKVYPRAPDAKKVQKKIEKLQKEAEAD